MKMNTRMSQLLTRLNVSLTAGTFPSIAKAEFTIVDDCVLLKNDGERANNVAAADFPDRTGFECFVNHVHRPYDETRESLQSCIQYATGLRTQLSEIQNGRQFAVIVSVSDDDCVVRFHQLRHGEHWLAEDLETYSQEGVLVLLDGDR